MSPESWALAPRTPGWTGPGVVVPLFLKKIDIDGKIQYQEICLEGITEDSSPGRDSSSVIPSLSLQLILRRKRLIQQTVRNWVGY